MSQVDVVIPVYNTPIRYVRDALNSVSQQSFEDWTTIVVNDGSAADYSLELESLIEEFAERRIRYLRSENRGLAAARNLGISSGKAPFVALLDSDDMWYPHKLARQVELLQGDAQTALLHADTDFLHGDTMDRLERMQPRALGLERLTPQETWRKLLRQNFVCVNTVVLRRSAGEKAGFFDPGFRALEDKEYWIRLLMSGFAMRHMPEVLAIYRKHDSNMSKSVDKMLAGRLGLIRKIDQLVERIPQWGKSDWSAARREMMRHAYVEVVETHLEAGQYAQALRFSMPAYVGVSSQALRGSVVAVLGLLGLRRTP